MAYSTNDAGPNNKLEQIRTHIGMLSDNVDILYYSLFLDFLPPSPRILELGTYIGGSLLFVNEYLGNHGITPKFTAVDNMEEIGISLTQTDTWNVAQRILTDEEYTVLSQVKTQDDAVNFIKSRSMAVTGFPIELEWFKKLTEVSGADYDIIFQDFGFGFKDNMGILNDCLPRLADSGVYIVDDYDCSHIGRVISTILAVEQKRLFPILWGSKKAFFAKTADRAKELVLLIAERNPDLIRSNRVLNAINNSAILRYDETYPDLGIYYKPLMDIGMLS